jgi:hypothetical protein
MASVKIDPGNRFEFEDLRLDEVRKRVAANVWAPDKLKAARAWIDEKEHGEESAHRRHSNWRANVALAMSGLSLLVALAALFWRK